MDLNKERVFDASGSWKAFCPERLRSRNSLCWILDSLHHLSEVKASFNLDLSRILYNLPWPVYQSYSHFFPTHMKKGEETHDYHYHYPYNYKFPLPLHYECIAMHYRCITISSPLHYQYIAMHYDAIPCIAWSCITMHSHTLPYITIHYHTVPCITIHCLTFPSIAIRYHTLPYISRH